MHERQLLFAVNTGKPDRIARRLIHAVKTLDELALVERLLDRWPPPLSLQLEAVKRRLLWIERVAVPRIRRLFADDDATIATSIGAGDAYRP